MKKIVKEITLIVLALVCAGFFLGTINISLFDGMQEIFQSREEQMADAPFSAVNGLPGAVRPQVVYEGGPLHKETQVVLKDLFLVSDAAAVIRLKDILDKDGNSRLLFLDSKSIEAMDEIPSAFIYDKANDILHIYDRGIYQMNLTVYVQGGAFDYELFIPVEEGGGGG